MLHPQAARISSGLMVKGHHDYIAALRIEPRGSQLGYGAVEGALHLVAARSRGGWTRPFAAE